MHLRELPTPALLIDLDKLERNIEGMAGRARQLGVALRPHVKTHKCIEVGRLQLQADAAGITVSTLYEGEVFADHGFEDITWAFPVSLSRLSQLESLARRTRLGVVVDSAAAVDALARVRAPLWIWIKVDCGYHRCGVDPDSDMPLSLARRIAGVGHQLAGVLSHSGDAYAHADRQRRQAVAEHERATIVTVAAALRGAGIEVPGVSVGSTPAMTAVQNLDGVSEVRPGNYVYFDGTQLALGSCELGDCAATVLAQVVSRQPRHSVIDAGALALSKDLGVSGMSDPGSPASMGAVFSDLAGDRLDDELYVHSLSQEHGKLSKALTVGTFVRVLPHHSCLTVACFDRCHVVRGDRVIDSWRIFNGR